MATYQFIIELIPEKWVKTNSKHNIEILFDTTDLYDLSSAWKDYLLKTDLNSILSNILPRSKARHADVTIWGDDEHSDVQVWLDNGKIDSIKIRLDLRENIDNLEENIVNLTKRLHCYFFLPTEKKIIKPDINLLNDIISNSNAANFVADPEAYIDEINKDKK